MASNAKQSRRSVHYGAAPLLTLRKCAFCSMYRRRGSAQGNPDTPSCTAVAGPISPAGECDLFEAGGGVLR